jgi:hypothetical protein
MTVKNDPPAAPIIPHCPHCDAEMVSLGLFSWQAGPWMLIAIHCPSCRKVLQIQPAPAGEPSRLAS